MAINATAWWLEQQTLVLTGDWLRGQVAMVLPLLPKTEITTIDLQAVMQVDSSLMTVLLCVREQSDQVCLRGVSATVAALLTLYRLDALFVREAVNDAV